MKNIGELIRSVDKYKTQAFKKECSERKKRHNINIKGRNQLLAHMAKLIAYSQQADSSKVREVIEGKAFKKAFLNFNVDKVRNLNPCIVVDKYWDEIKGIRQKTKIFQIILLARCLYKDKPLYNLLLKSKIPKKIYTKDELNLFWEKFFELKGALKKRSVPFFSETTTLLHFLLTLGYDCAKPDSAVMQAAENLQIVPSKQGQRNLIETVKAMQSYSILHKRKYPPAVLDLYMLVEGGQKDAQKYVSNRFYVR